MTPRLHVVDAQARWYRALADGDKTHEVRRTHRDYQRGDELHVLNLDNASDPALRFRITHVLTGTGEYGLLPGFAVLSLRPIGSPAP